MKIITKIKKSVERMQISSRGGGIEISLAKFGYKGSFMSAYQNYLGGGMLGAVASDCSIIDWKEDEKLLEISEELKKYFHSLTNPETEWEGSSYEANQNRSLSAY